MSLIVYIHGFNSSASSYKAGVIQSAIQDHDKELQFWCPDLPHWPNEAVARLEREISRYDEVTLIGSSLGGYYATYLTERLGHRCVLINPAITPHEGLSAYVGKQTNLYTKEEYEFTVDGEKTKISVELQKEPAKRPPARTYVPRPKPKPAPAPTVKKPSLGGGELVDPWN